MFRKYWRKIARRIAQRWWLVGLILALLLFFAGRHWAVSRQQKWQFVHPQRRSLVASLNLAGHIDAQEKVTLRFKTSGKLAWVGVKEGDRVKKYQAIASLDKRELERDFRKAMASYLKTRNNFEQANADYGYWQHWFELNDAAKRALANDQYDLNRAVADVELAHLALEEATLVTPIAGIVTKVDAPYAGVNITPATAEFEIVNPATVYFRAEVDEDGVGKLKVGQKAKVNLDAYPGQSFPGAIKNISFQSVGSGTSPSYRVKIALAADNRDLRFRLGMDGEALITVARRDNVLAVPLLAVVNKNGQSYVWVWQKGHRHRQTIVTGLTTDEWVEVKSGLQGQETLVLP